MESIEVKGDEIDAHVGNLGRASTSNITLQYSDSSGQVLWNSSLFGVNATNQIKITLDARNLTLIEDGNWSIFYQKRVIDASQWVEENIDDSVVEIRNNKEGLLPRCHFGGDVIAYKAQRLDAVGPNRDAGSRVAPHRGGSLVHVRVHADSPERYGRGETPDATSHYHRGEIIILVGLGTGPDE